MAQNRARFKKALKKGFQYNADENWQKAMGAFRLAISEFPKEPMPYVGLGEACFGRKQLDKALDCYKLAARYSGGDLAYLRKVADIQERLGQLTDAGRTYMAAGELLLRQRQFDEAIGMWQLAVRLEPSLLAAHRRLAMVFQRQNRRRDAVREYLAIARILDDRGDKLKALKMCQAAQRLDPDNEDVIMATRLIREGIDALQKPEEDEEVSLLTAESEDGMTQMVRQMASIFASEKQEQPAPTAQLGLVEQAHRLAQDKLAEEIFREDENGVTAGAGLSKLERDALLGQGMDFEARGHIEDAVGCYEKAIHGGLRLPAAFFTLGLLYMKQNRADVAKRALAIAVKDPTYLEASKLILSQN